MRSHGASMQHTRLLISSETRASHHPTVSPFEHRNPGPTQEAGGERGRAWGWGQALLALCPHLPSPEAQGSHHPATP